MIFEHQEIFDHKVNIDGIAHDANSIKENGGKISSPGHVDASLDEHEHND